MADVQAPAGLETMRSRYPARIVRVQELDWRVRDAGGGSIPLILLPGSLGNADIFYKQLLALAGRIRCVAVDYPDAGEIELSDGLAGLLDALALTRAWLLGSSLAGHWLQFFGALHPERVAGLVLANAFCDSAELREHPLFSIPTLRAADGDALKAEWLARIAARGPDELRDVQIELLRDGQAGESLRRRLLAAATALPAPAVPPGRFPIAVLDCEDDPILSARTRAALAGRHPDARRLTLPTGGHYPHVVQAAAYSQFLSEVVARR